MLMIVLLNIIITILNQIMPMILRILGQKRHRFDSTAYTDLHITACADYSRSHRGHGYESSILLPLGGFHHQPKHGQIDTKQPGKAFFSSPHEQASEEPDSESHTTTLTYSHDDHPHVRSIHLTDDTVVHSISLIGHHRHHPVPPKGPERDNLERMPSIKDDLTTPEPIVSIASPTRVSTYQDSVIDHDRYHQDHYFDQNAAVDDNRHKEDRIHPPAPTPEPVPAAATHSSSPGSGSNHHIQQNHGHHNHNHQRDEMKGYMSKETMISHQTVRHHEQQLKPHQKGEDQGFRTVVHRVTTLIIETETIVAHPPQSTQGPEDHHHSQQNGKEFHLGDHIMFDAGEEGDMIVSIASQEQADHHRPHQNVKKNDAKSGKTKDEL
ncbi:hypothetical protein BGZ83_000694 [Gryganskiella cystojenkinii]|nr:hypothetical protein BGZ83_000694 [Gryganskiella cystojenkinii]